MPAFDSVLAAMERRGDEWVADGSINWLQGRTLYGGLSAALALRACELAAPELPPLRAAQIAFIGPVMRHVVLRPMLLRQGRSVSFMGCDLYSDDRLALRAIFTFGAARESAYQVAAPPPPSLPAPETCDPLWHGGGPAFATNFDYRVAGPLRPFVNADRGELLVWARHARPTAPGMAAVVGLADALPPASFTRLATPAIISSVTWGFELFAPGAADGSGWVLLHSRDDGLGEGYAGQEMAMWDESGRPILRGRQSVAIFA